MSECADQGCINLRWARALMAGLVAGGMGQLVISPGSRSTPLVLAAQQQRALGLTSIVDERSAAFFALGAARSSGRPVGVLCTSGSALAHWLPAVIEASESEVALILLSADRPPELRAWGANQTIDQARLFGLYVRAFYDPGLAETTPAALKMIYALGLRAAAVSLGRWPGPVHLNLPFREPLVPGPDCDGRSCVDLDARSGAVGLKTRALGMDRGDAVSDLTSMMRGRGLICCGPGVWSSEQADELWRCARRLGVPVLCDPLSGLRFGPGGVQRITRYDSVLRHRAAAAALKPDWILRFGRAPVSKTLLGWMADVATVLVSPGGVWSDPNHDVRRCIAADPATLCCWLADGEQPGGADPGWLDQWVAAERRLDRLASEYLAHAPWCEAHLLVDLLELLPQGEGLLCANSMPIRQLDIWSGGRESALRIFGNRGASGIDGQTSTLAGLNAGGVPTTGLLGDLSFLHDLSGLLLLGDLDRPCVVINNGGGRIFDYLPQHGLPGFERFWRTPVALDLAALTHPFGLSHCAVSDGAGFRAALSEALDRGRTPDARQVIEVCVDGDLSGAVHQEFWRSVGEERFD